MTILDLAAGQVMLRCPACRASEAADSAVLAGSPRIVCRNCGETWPAGLQRPQRLALTGPAPEIKHQGAEPHPGAFEAGPGKLGAAWAARIEADMAPPPRPVRAPYAGAALGAVLFALAFVAGREVAVVALPDLAGLYAAVGMPVNLPGLAIEDIAAEQTDGPSGAQLTVRGNVRNISGANKSMPPLVAELAAATGEAMAVHGFEPPVAGLAAGGSAPFVLRISQAPPGAVDVAVRFGRPAETWPTAGPLELR